MQASIIAFGILLIIIIVTVTENKKLIIPVSFSTLILAFTMFLCYFVTIPNYSEGKVVGTLEKVSTKVLFFKTHEIDIVLSSGDIMTREIKSLSTTNQNVKDSLSQYINQKVTLEYKQNYLTSIKRGKTNYNVVGFEIIK